MIQFFNETFQINLSGGAIIGIIAVTIVSFIALFAVIMLLLRRVSDLQKPKYGFLGKPLYSLILLVGIGATLVFFSYSFSNQPDFSIDAERTITADISAITVNPGETSSLLKIKATPFVDGIEYGELNDTFDLFWKFTGPTTADKFEFEVSRSKLSGFDINLPNGVYDLNLIIVYKDKSHSFTQQLYVP